MMIPAWLFALATSGILVQATPLQRRDDSNKSASPTIDLGDAGIYIGKLQNNGTVQSWKGIPYATPPIGDLRFKAPRSLTSQAGKTPVDVSDDALRCVQFGAPSNIVGVKSGPGVEDCLKLWVWKPTSAKAGDKLPVMVYTHGGGLQYSAAANNDFSDWVGQDQNFIAVNAAYRVGGFGFFASDELLAEGEPANAGLLDSRLAYDWIKANIDKFGGDPDQITIMGQSGGGFAIVSQLALYDGAKPNFQRACARSVQRSPMFTVAEHSDRNARLATILGCSNSTSQIDCFRQADPYVFVNATNQLGQYQNSNGLAYGGFLPTVDGVTLTDTITNLWLSGKFSKVPFIGGYVTDEASIGTSTAPAVLNATSLGYYNFSQEQSDKVVSFYPVNSSYSDPSGTGNFQLSPLEVTRQAAAAFGEGGISGSERLTNRAMCDHGACDTTWGFRFDAPTVGTKYYDETVPLAPVVHSADNSYLQNATSVMRPFELSVAQEWRAYIASFIKTGDPNTQKLDSARKWPSYGALDYDATPIRLVPTFAFESNAHEDAPTGTQPEIGARPQLQRSGWFLQPEQVEASRV